MHNNRRATFSQWCCAVLSCTSMNVMHAHDWMSAQPQPSCTLLALAPVRLFFSCHAVSVVVLRRAQAGVMAGSWKGGLAAPH